MKTKQAKTKTGSFRNYASTLISNISIITNGFSTIYGTFVSDTLQVYASTLGAGNDLYSDIHTAVIASDSQRQVCSSKKRAKQKEHMSIKSSNGCLQNLRKHFREI